MAPNLLLFLLTLLTNIIFNNTTTIFVAAALPRFSTILIFGDSTVDTGNNNYVNTIFKGDHLPYGQDFPNHIPTGRFSNGKLIPDFASSLLGIKETVPPFLDPNLSNNDIISGVCFASAGSGYDDLTTVATAVIPVSKQLDLFRDYISRLQGIVGEEESTKIINGALVIISAGTNDFIDNYYDAPTRKQQFKNISGYQDFLLNNVQNFVKELYNLGGRFIAIAGLPPIGCLPVQITATRFTNLRDRNCIEEQNSDSQGYNKKLVNLVSELQASLAGSRIIYANVYDPLIDMATQPQKYGFVETRRGCCGTGLIEAAAMCHAATPTCAMPNQFMFWDAIHPTQSAYKVLTDFLYQTLSQIFSSP